MAKLTMNIDPELKQDAAELFEKMGLNMTTAITMFLKQSVRDGMLPFQPSSYPTGFKIGYPKHQMDHKKMIEEAKADRDSIKLPSYIGKLTPDDVKEELSRREK
ncbi:type II toxin-antitoxin system RelB/DinJ family antitoxin [Bifidobacterium sp. ESL0745]|uniref:type II toxin-antitoxin system RelB/DinJ family antitoxin n=1 Tax=Bifidobacterium sp. ESL0745 TaxID=2983226 RepID=UPI0023F7655D|nr:type II toxin-antitoxin system RelB/DinJ family antitoxin [Bifidobacterium sp. ESL0745]MDF7665363.1 type II toxin-antitoxin system RelB/DinJ family antitoxin [Bifidobacterium sp. ESL0745]